MLGVRSSHTTLRGESARRFLEKFVRIQTGNLNADDIKEIKAIERRRKESRWQVEWEL